MMFPFFNRLQIRKITAAGTDAAAQQAHALVAGLLSDLPDLLMTCVVEIESGRILASYTAHASFSPNHVSLRYAKLVRSLRATLATQPWVDGPLTDIALLLEDQAHYLRLLHHDEWYCFLAAHTAVSNLAMTKEIMRRHTSQE